MTDEEYIELNDYLNDIFLKLEKNDYFFLENLDMISYLAYRYCELVSKYNLETYQIDRKLSFEDVYQLAGEIIESIDPKYAEDFSKIIQTGELDFDYDNKYFDSHLITRENENGKINLINLKRTYNYDEVKTLVHEFIHYTNADKHTVKRHILGEYLSITGELYAENYMRNKGIDVSEINSNLRLKTTYDRCSELSWIIDVLIAYQKIGKISENNISFITENIVDVTNDEFITECKYLLKLIKERKDKTNIDVPELKFEYDDSISLACIYLMGTLFAFYTIKHCKIEDIVNMNNHINDDDLFIIDTLQKVGFDLEKESTINEMFNCIEKYLEKNNCKKR